MPESMPELVVPWGLSRPRPNSPSAAQDAPSSSLNVVLEVVA